ncbi:HNH endonuclease signature motif containing protein [Naasia sp. SYSU D00948]|uniref:HNH endonuclease signature motif containing protein n=1 Tax=Naasia sp. SYSU D00948 TaxID=2817379 RepID=UPI001B30502F|nr:HNH endonuclease signature motif containing protein [Naasia sp. SYSU D00948]
MFEEAPPDPESPEAYQGRLSDAERAAWEELTGRWTWEQRLAQRIAERSARAATLAAEQFALLDDLRLEAERTTGASWTDRDSLAWRELRAEVAGLLQVHERTAEPMLDLARELVHRFPATLEELHRAAFTERHARIVAEEGAGVPDELAAEYERRVLPYARTLVPSRLRAMAATIRAQLCPEDLVERHRQAVTERRTAIEAAPDGMAWYGALMEASDAIGAAAAVHGIARTLLVDGETRTLQQIEADVVRDLLTDAGGVTLPVSAGDEPQSTPGAQRGLRPEVALHVPVLTAMGRSDSPAVLEGYGPIDAVTARRMAGCATGFLRILTDPETGAVLSVGRESYRVPSDLKRHLRIRDGVCRFVGCTRPARYCDIDHTVAWVEDGETVTSNLAHLCRGHHRLKHGSRWRLSQSPGGDGILTWTSPTGRTYTSSPQVKLPPERPPRSRPGAPLFVQRQWADDPPF